jgi:hypothetical protein
VRFGSPKRPYLDQHRIIRRFLWWPVSIGHETRWLEFAEIEQRYCGLINAAESWEPIRFINQ